MTALDIFAAVDQPDLWAARTQMALSLAWHIVIACFGVGLPLLVVVAEYRAQRTGSQVLRDLARRWAQVLGVLFAVGAVSGTILSFEMGILWPRLMATFGSVLGLPFAIEGIAFFVEAIFIGIYLYGWDRLSPRAHLLSGIPIVISGVASAWFVVTANAWLNQPVGFTLTNGVVTSVDPWAAIRNPATPVETTHMVVAALMVSGFGVAAGHAWHLWRDPTSKLHRTGFRLAFTLGALLTPGPDRRRRRRRPVPRDQPADQARGDRGALPSRSGRRPSRSVAFRSTATCTSPSRSRPGSRSWHSATRMPWCRV